jgi:uncharacterized membrane protein YhiD involved in acid resistance
MRSAITTYRARGALLSMLVVGVGLAGPGSALARAVHPCIKGWCRHGAVHSQGNPGLVLGIGAMFIAIAVAVLVVECRTASGEPLARLRAPRFATRRRDHAERAAPSVSVMRRPQ